MECPRKSIENECRDLEEILPDDFEFSKGYIIPGQMIGSNLMPLYNPEETVLALMLCCGI
jgi:hypothetical protein